VCGITGYWRPGEGIGAPDAIEAMMDAIAHRGPDGRGVHVDEDAGLVMGHVRLSIIGLDDGAQPIASADGRRTLTVNGEFYDYKRIRAEMACDGARFRTSSDSEIALPLHERHGRDFVHRLRGEFAVALHDAGRRELLLVRDRFGIKPLYYKLTEDGLWWGSEVKAILAHPDVEPRLSARAALHQMMQVMVPGTTAFEGVRALKPGHMLVVRERNGRLEGREVRYWDLTFPMAADHAAPDDAEAARCIDGVRDRLIDAVRVRLEADVPVACYLSGGLDSCAILGLASPLMQSSVTAFTIGFDDDAYDEVAIAREMAQRAHADQVVLPLAAEGLYGDDFATVVRHAERTFYNTLSVAKWHMSRHVREHGFKVVITGEGSDELFGGYPFFKRDMFLHGGPAEERHRAAMERGNRLFRGAILAEEHRRHEAFDELCGFTPSWIQPWMITLDEARPLMAEPLADALEGYDPLAAIAAEIDPDMVRGRHPLDVAQYTWSKTMLEGQILSWGGDRVDMAHALESRPAFLDHHLAEFATGVPPELRIRDGVEKWVLREAMRGVLPDVLYRREKFPFMAPPSHTDAAKRRGVETLLARWASPERVAAAGLFDPEAVDATLARWRDDASRDGGNRADILVNHLLGMQILHETASAPAMT
jgi:asparagine synthase (glutamine-hydrolysing)